MYIVCDVKAIPVTSYMTIPMAPADDSFGGYQFCVVFSHKVSWVGSATELCQFLRIFLPKGLAIKIAIYRYAYTEQY